MTENRYNPFMDYDRLKGSFIYWPLAGQQFESFPIINENINNILVSIADLAIYNNISDIRYVYNYEKVFFLKKGRANVIFSQYFPDADKNQLKNVKGKLEFAQNYFKENDFRPYNLYDYSIIKLASTKKFLYAITKANNELFISKFIVNEDGLSSEIHHNKISSAFKEDDLAAIDFEVKDFSDFESIIIINLKGKRKLYIGKFKTVRKRIIQFQDINKLIDGSVFEPVSTTLISDLKTNYLLFYDASLKSIIISKFDESLKFNNTGRIELDINSVIGIRSYQLNTKNLNNKNIPDLKIQLILILTNTIIWTLDFKTHNLSLLMGSGNIDLTTYTKYTTNLNDFKLHTQDLIYPIDNNGFIFGSLKTEEFFALLSPKSRDLFFTKISPQRYSGIMNEDFGIS